MLDWDYLILLMMKKKFLARQKDLLLKKGELLSGLYNRILKWIKSIDTHGAADVQQESYCETLWWRSYAGIHILYTVYNRCRGRPNFRLLNLKTDMPNCTRIMLFYLLI